MKFFLCILLTLASFQSPAQLIHAHNDYQKPEPLTNAIRYKAFSIEADIYLSGGRLLVAHDKSELVTAKTLDSLYLQPIIELFRQHKGSISADSNYAPILVIDIKENAQAAIAALIKLLSPHRSVFDRSVNAKAVQIVISGDRGNIANWISYPSYILFDGRPNESYDNTTLQRVAFISDNWLLYYGQHDDNYTLLKQVIEKVHAKSKRIRLWGSADYTDSWNLQRRLGVDIINTDKVGECRKYFSVRNQ
jgi:alkaline phosphatase